MYQKPVVFLLGILFSTAVSAQLPAGYKSYCNARFSYCVPYPAAMTPQPESQNRDGRIFKDARTGAILTVWGRINQDAEGAPVSLKAQYKEDLQQMQEEKSRKVTYSKIGTNFFVISGYVDKRIFYQKTFYRKVPLPIWFWNMTNSLKPNMMLFQSRLPADCGKAAWERVL